MEHVSTTISGNLDVYGLIYHNIPLKDVTKVDILKKLYSDPQKKRKYCDNLIKKKSNEKLYR